MIANQRDKFDIPEDITYLNCAFMSPLMHVVVDALDKGAQAKRHPWTIKSQDFVKPCDQFKSSAAKLIGTKAENIAIIPAASYGIQVAANNLPLSSGGQIIVLADQFPSNVYPWIEKAKACAGQIITVSRPKGEGWSEAILDAINDKTQIIALAAVHWADGGIIDLQRISARAHQVGAALVLDLTQSLGVMPFDISKIQPDFMIAACYKWLMGPYSYGMMYVAPKWQNGIPLEQTWLAKQGSEDFSGLTNYRDGFQGGAVRFDMGEKSNAGQAWAASAAIEQILNWGVGEMYQTLSARNSRYAAKARAMGLLVDPCDQRAGHYLSICFPNGRPDTFLTECESQNIFISSRGPSLRITPHLYNTDADLDRVFAVMEKAL